MVDQAVGCYDRASTSWTNIKSLEHNKRNWVDKTVNVKVDVVAVIRCYESFLRRYDGCYEQEGCCEQVIELQRHEDVEYLILKSERNETCTLRSQPCTVVYVASIVLLNNSSWIIQKCIAAGIRRGLCVQKMFSVWRCHRNVAAV